MSATSTVRAARERPRTRRLTGAAVVAALVGTWVGGAWLVRQQVEVTRSPTVTCEGTESRAGVDPTEVITLHPSMACDLTVQVRNGSWAPVSIAEIVLPVMGPEGGAAVQVESFEGRPPLDLPDWRDAGTDAVFAVDDWLAPGAARDLTVRFTHRPGGCSAAGTSTIEEIPDVRVSALGLRGGRAAPGTLGFTSAEQTDCDL